MKPGIDLDLLVAEKVMGWTKGHIHEGEVMMLPPNPSENEAYQSPPAFSTNLENAWEVVEKLRSMNLSIDVHAYPEGRKWLKPNEDESEWVLTPATTFYQSTICKEEDHGGCWFVLCDAEGTNPAHAICLAALEALKLS